MATTKQKESLSIIAGAIITVGGIIVGIASGATVLLAIGLMVISFGICWLVYIWFPKYVWISITLCLLVTVGVPIIQGNTNTDKEAKVSVNAPNNQGNIIGNVQGNVTIQTQSPDRILSAQDKQRIIDTLKSENFTSVAVGAISDPEAQQYAAQIRDYVYTLGYPVQGFIFGEAYYPFRGFNFDKDYTGLMKIIVGYK